MRGLKGNDRCLPSPLAEPDGRIARIRRSPKSPRHQHSQFLQSQTSDGVAEVFAFGPGPTSLTSALEGSDQPAPHLRIEVIESLARIAQTEVLPPTAQY